MKIIAKKGTALEQTIKEMCEKMSEGFIRTLDLVEGAVGVRPMNVYNVYHWGTISEMVPEFVFDAHDVENISPNYLRRSKKSKDSWVPALRYKGGRKLYHAFYELAQKYKVTDVPLSKYGINMVDWKNGYSYRIKPFHDLESDRYMLVCSDGTPRAFDKKKLAREMFEIEY